MNDVSLHTRLASLADDLATDVDPYEQAAAARGLHRRQRRTRLGVAGAALAVAVVAVGVPTAVGTLSAPGDGDVARPSESEPLRGPADAVRGWMAWWEEDGSVPDPARGLPCPDASATLSDLDSRYAFEETVSRAGDSTLTGCHWTTDPDGGTAAEERIDLAMAADPDLDADRVASSVEADALVGECSSATLFPQLTPNVLQVCEGSGQQEWRLTVVDDDGTGAWTVTAAAGTDVDARFAVSASAVGMLWGIVSDPSITGGVPGKIPGAPPTGEDGRLADRWSDTLDEREADVAALSPLADALRADLGAGVPVSVPEPGAGMRCPDAVAALSAATGMYELAAANPGSLTSEGCVWSLASPASSAWDSLDLGLRSDPDLTAELLQREYNAVTNQGGCYPSAMPGSVGFSAVLVCGGEAGTSWTLTLLADDGTGGWVLTVDVGADLPEAFGTGKASVLALREVVVGGL